MCIYYDSFKLGVVLFLAYGDKLVLFYFLVWVPLNIFRHTTTCKQKTSNYKVLVFYFNYTILI